MINATNIQRIQSKYDGENLAGNGIRFEFGGRKYTYQWFDLGYQLSVQHEGRTVGPALLKMRYRDDWRSVIATNAAEYLGIQYHDNGAYRIEAVDAAFANDMAEIYAAEKELQAMIKPAAYDGIVDRTPWQKGDEQMPEGSYIV